MIPNTEYIDVEGILVITYDLIKKHHTTEEFEDFVRWMRGQTCLMMPNGEAGIYSWDYERWVKQGMDTEQGEDWD